MPDKKGAIQPIEATFDEVVDAIVPNENQVVPYSDTSGMAKATHRGILPIGGLQLDCYVLEDGRRVFHKRGMARALGLKSEGGNAFMKTLSGKKLRSEMDPELWEKIRSPIFINPLGVDPAHAYEANVLVEVCKTVGRAHDAGKLTKAQEPMARQARAIISALARVGIIALIDEATGYQTVRDPGALRLLVEAYIEKEKREWEKEFPDDFYITLNKVYRSDPYIKRAKGALVINKPQHFGNFTNKYVYGPLENGEVLRELQRINPQIDAKGTRKQRFHQFLKKGYGLAKLREQRQEILTILKLSDNIEDFKRLYEKRFGPLDDQYSIFPDFFLDSELSRGTNFT